MVDSGGAEPAHPTQVSADSAYLSSLHAAFLAASAEPVCDTRAGTFVFADISGFTPLTERMAKLGRIGAEELTEVLNGCYAPLLTVAEESGGDMLKYGGDAVLLWFEGRAHQSRAAGAALRMQQALRPLRQLRTEAGSVRLGMSVGVGSGLGHFFVVGDVHRELVVAGPALTDALTLEAAARTGEVVVGPSEVHTAGDVARWRFGAERGPGVVVRAAPPIDLVAPRSAAPALADPRIGIPLALRDRSGGEGEHRQVAVSFVQVQGVDRMLAEHGAAATLAALDDVVTSAQRACAEHGVAFLPTDVDKGGLKLILVAGAPTASPDDGDRLLGAVRSIVTRSQPLPVRAGVNHGRVFTVDLGIEHRRFYAVIGDAMNLSARVMGKSEPGVVLATTGVLDHARTRFALEPVEPFLVKGKSTLVRAAKVGPPLGQRVTAAPTAPIVGRDRELAVLRDCVAAVGEGRGAVVELVGEPGIGKSRLVAELLADAATAGLPVVRVEAGQYASMTPYFAVRRPLRELVGLSWSATEDEIGKRLTKLLPRRQREWLPLVAVPFGVTLPDTRATARLDPRFRRARSHAIVAERLGSVLTERGLLVIEDGHWLDDASTELLQDLVARFAGRAWSVCLTRRPGTKGLTFADNDAATRLDLEPLDESVTRRLLDAVDDGAIPPAVRAALIARSGGNPLFLEELVSAARAGTAVADLPDTVEAVIAGRLDTLAGRDRALLGTASVLGNRFPRSWLEAMVDEPGDVAASLPLVADFLGATTDGMLRFRHALLREGAYERLPYRRRRALHAKAGELIERDARVSLAERAEVLSLHYSAAQRWPDAWRFGRLAASRAARNAAPVEAALFCRRALDAAAHLDDLDAVEVREIAELLGEACVVIGEYDGAAAAFRRARALAADDSGATALLCAKEGRLRERSGRYADALRWYRRGLDVLAAEPDTPAVVTARLDLQLAYGATRTRQARHADAARVLEEVVATAAAVGDLGTQARALRYLSNAYSELRDPRAEECGKQALALAVRTGDLNLQAVVHNSLGVIAYYDGRWTEALEHYGHSAVAQEQLGDVVLAALDHCNVGEVQSDRGLLDEAEARFKDALIVFRSAKYGFGAGFAELHLGRIAARRGDFAGSRERLDAARAVFTRIGAESYLLEVDGCEAERLLLSGEAAAAAELAATAARAAEHTGNHVLMAQLERLAGSAAFRCGDAGAAVTRLERSVTHARTADAPYEVALSLRALAAVTGRDDLLDEARESLDRLGVRETTDLIALG